MSYTTDQWRQDYKDAEHGLQGIAEKREEVERDVQILKDHLVQADDEIERLRSQVEDLQDQLDNEE